MARPCKVLNVAEKNDAARELSRVMSRGRFDKREGFSKFNKIYEFDFTILGKECKMVMTSVSGHLLSLDFALAYKSWKSCSPGSLFTAEIRKFCPDNFTPIKRTLEREIRGCQHLILWTDGDREGENIAEEIMQVCTQVKKTVQVHRARFSEITPQSIMRACAMLGRLDQNMSDAVKVRQELDLRIGCAFTRFQTIRLKQVFPSVLSDQLISYGPCQFPTLGFVVERYKQVQAFIPETFHKIKVVHDTTEGRVEFSWKRVRLFNHTVCLILYQMCLEAPTACVTSINSRQRSKWRPLPLDTVELEKQASRKLKINAKETMRVAEKLYTQGFISYPRTETNMFPASFDLPAIVTAQTADSNWGGFAAQLLTRGVTPRQGNKTDNAHPPIYPTKYANSLQGNEQRIYEYVVRHFLACCSQNAEGQETSVEIEVAGESFSAQGLIITARNYLDVFPYDRWSDKTIPAYQQGITFQPSSIEMVEGETTPPPLLQEADLIGLMEKHGIGTDATHAEHIETIKNRNYVGVQPDGYFVPGELGMGLVEGYDSMGYELAKPRLRAELESDLKLICDGIKRRDDVVTSTIDKYKDVFQKAFQEAHKLDEALSKYFGAPQQFTQQEEYILSEAVRVCPVCRGKDMVVRRKKDGGFMLSCLGYPECRAVQFFPPCVVSAQPHTTLCGTCQPPPVHYVELHFKPGSVPPAIPRELTACTTCDQTLLRDLLFPGIRVTQPRNTPTPGSSTSTSTSGRGRGQRVSPGRGARGGSGDVRRGGERGRGRGRGSDEGDGNMWGGDGGWRGGGGGGGGGASGSISFAVSSQSSSGYGPSAPSTFPTSDPGPTSDNPPVCDCGEQAVLLTVRKEGPNTGRQFYKCSKRDGGCDFFLWSDQTLPSTPSLPPPSPAFTSGYSSMNRPSAPSTFPTSDPGPTSDNPPVCDCGEQAVLLTVRKEGPNTGRQFYKCSKRDGGCDFFLWSDQTLPSTPSLPPPSLPPPSLPPPSPAFTSGYSSMNRPSAPSTFPTSDPGPTSDNPPVCDCGEQAVLLTVRKEGPNTGRQFYKCSKRDGGCDFFLWSDQTLPSTPSLPPPSLPPPSPAFTSGYSSMNSSSSQGPGFLSVQRKRSSNRGERTGGSRNSRDSVETVVCNCGQDAVQRTVQKDGPNKGRQFFTCPKPREDQCGFFEWADDVPSSNMRTGGGSQRSGQRERGRGRGGGGGGGGEGRGGKRKPPTCSVCRQPGHTKRSCSVAKQLNNS